MNEFVALRLLVVEDEPELREAMVAYLRSESFATEGVGSIRAALEWLDSQIPDIIVLDLGLPDGESLAMIEDPRLARSGVIITTARSRAEDRLLGVKMGADAYLVKPIQLEELSLVIRNLYRRLQTQTVPRDEKSWRLQKINWSLTAPSGESMLLTRSEVLILGELARAVGEGVSRHVLISCLGHNPETYDWRRMEILMRRLRNKCKTALGLELPVRTVHGFGYAFIEGIQVQ